jgi:hypothetical protein
MRYVGLNTLAPPNGATPKKCRMKSFHDVAHTLVAADI